MLDTSNNDSETLNFHVRRPLFQHHNHHHQQQHPTTDATTNTTTQYVSQSALQTPSSSSTHTNASLAKSSSSSQIYKPTTNIISGNVHGSHTSLRSLERIERLSRTEQAVVELFHPELQQMHSQQQQNHHHDQHNNNGISNNRFQMELRHSQAMHPTQTTSTSANTSVTAPEAGNLSPGSISREDEDDVIGGTNGGRLVNGLRSWSQTSLTTFFRTWFGVHVQDSTIENGNANASVYVETPIPLSSTSSMLPRSRSASTIHTRPPRAAPPLPVSLPSPPPHAHQPYHSYYHHTLYPPSQSHPRLSPLSQNYHTPNFNVQININIHNNNYNPTSNSNTSNSTSNFIADPLPGASPTSFNSNHNNTNPPFSYYVPAPAPFSVNYQPSFEYSYVHLKGGVCGCWEELGVEVVEVEEEEDLVFAFEEEEEEGGFDVKADGGVGEEGEDEEEDRLEKGKVGDGGVSGLNGGGGGGVGEDIKGEMERGRLMTSWSNTTLFSLNSHDSTAPLLGASNSSDGTPFFSLSALSSSRNPTHSTRNGGVGASTASVAAATAAEEASQVRDTNRIESISGGGGGVVVRGRGSSASSGSSHTSSSSSSSDTTNGHDDHEHASGTSPSSTTIVSSPPLPLPKSSKLAHPPHTSQKMANINPPNFSKPLPSTLICTYTTPSNTSSPESTSTNLNLLCPLCTSLPQTPLLLPCCDNLVCGQCIHHWFTHKRSARCPFCRSLVREGACKIAEEVKTVLDGLRVRCPFYKVVGGVDGEDAGAGGCKWVGPRDDLKDHVLGCEIGKGELVIRYIHRYNSMLFFFF
jgi:hypothetical protein